MHRSLDTKYNELMATINADQELLTLVSASSFAKARPQLKKVWQETLTKMKDLEKALDGIDSDASALVDMKSRQDSSA